MIPEPHIFSYFHLIFSTFVSAQYTLDYFIRYRAHPDIVYYHQFSERPWYLVRTGNSHLYPLMGRMVADLLSLEVNAAGVLFQGSHDEIEYRGFTRPVWPHEAEGFALFQMKTQVVDRHEASKFFREAFYFKKLGHTVHLFLLYFPGNS